MRRLAPHPPSPPAGPTRPSTGVARIPQAIPLLAIVVCWLAGAAGAATVDLPAPASDLRGEPFEQRFLDGGVSVIRTVRGQSCVASARIAIEASSYEDADGLVVPVSGIIRSPAASIQAIQGPGPEGALAFRIQLKFSPRIGSPVSLVMGEGGSEAMLVLDRDLEASTDSLRIEGAGARRLHDALAAGETVRLRAVSRDTGHRVVDRIPELDLSGLASCVAGLAAAASEVLPPPAMPVSLRFEATPSPESVAAPEDLRACRIGATDRPLHVGRLVSVTGFFAQTDRIFVAFDAEGHVEHAYVPGIIDADFTSGTAGTLRVSQAADGNVPDAPNAVTGCIGSHAVVACVRADGPGRHAIASCASLDGEDVPSSATRASEGLGRIALLGSPTGAGAIGRPSIGGPGPSSPTDGNGLAHWNAGPGDDTTEGGSGGHGGTMEPPPVVPLPLGGTLLLGALGGMAALARRRRAIAGP